MKAIRVAANFDQFCTRRPGFYSQLEHISQHATKSFPLLAPNAELLVEAFEMREKLRREAALKYAHGEGRTA